MGIYTIDPSWRSRVIGNRQIQEQSKPKPPKSVPQKAKKNGNFILYFLLFKVEHIGFFFSISVPSFITYCDDVVIFNALGFDSSRNLLITQVIKMLQIQNRPFFYNYNKIKDCIPAFGLGHSSKY